MVPVIVNGKLVVNALLDSGSTNTFIPESLASTLQLPGKVTSFNLSTPSQKGVKNWKAVSVHLSPIGGGDPVRVDNVLVTPGIPTRCPNLVVDTEKYPHLLGVLLKSAGQCDNADLLIGMDNAHLLMPLEIRRNVKFVNEPYAVRSYFGFAWLFSRLFRWGVCQLRESWETGGKFMAFWCRRQFRECNVGSGSEGTQVLGQWDKSWQGTLQAAYTLAWWAAQFTQQQVYGHL